MHHQAHESQYTPLDYESITVTDTAESLTSGTFKPVSTPEHAWAKRAFITAETAQMRYRLDGTAPTSSEGHILNVGDILTLDGIANISRFQIIRTGSTSGVIKISYLR